MNARQCRRSIFEDRWNGDLRGRIARRLLGAMFVAGATGAAKITPAHAEANTAGELVAACRAPAASAQSAFCLGFVAGIGSILDANGYLIESGTLVDPSLAGVALCSKPSTKSEELLATFFAWADSHAAALNRPAAIGVVEALTERWPCAAEVTPQ